MVDPGDCSAHRPEPAADRPAAGLGAEIRRLRQAHGISQQALVRMIGLSAHSNLSDYEAGRRLPPADIVSECERILQVTDGHLQSLRALALADRAGNSRERISLIEVDQHRQDGARGKTWRVFLTQAGSAAGAIFAGAAIFAVASLGSAAGPSRPITMSHAGKGAGPATCVRGARRWASAPLRIVGGMSATTQHKEDGDAIAGHVEFLYSPRCQSVFARLVLTHYLTSRAHGDVSVYLATPADKTRSTFQTGGVQPVFVSMPVTVRGCVLAGGSIRWEDGAEATAVTPCVVIRVV